MQHIQVGGNIRSKTNFASRTGKTSFLYFLKCSFIFERERESVPAGEGQRERGGERIPSRLPAVSPEPYAGLSPTNREIMTSAKVKC